MSIMRQVLPDPKLSNEQCATLFEDFNAYVTATAQGFTTLAGSSGTTAFSSVPINTNSGATDTVLATSAATAWDAQGLYQTNPNILPIALNQAAFAEAYSSAVGVHAAGSAMEFFGLSSSHAIQPASNVDPSASYSGAIIYKLSGDTYWRCQSSNGSAKTTTVSRLPVVEGANKFRIDIIGYDGANCAVSYKVNNKILMDVNGLQINHVVPYSSLAKMGLLWFVQSDTSASAQTGQLDYISSGRFRSLLNA